MELKFCSIASGSKGNCYVIWKGEEAYLIDVGISGKKIEEGLRDIGLSIEKVKAVFITHEHVDHTKSIKIIYNKNPNIKIYTREATWENLVEERLKDRSLDHGFVPLFDEIFIDDIKVSAIELSHDAVDPIGFKFEHKGRIAVVLTDTGTIDERIFNKIKDAHLLVLESNHEESILQVCRYPYKVKMRILSDYGHLSNDVASKCIDKILKYRKDELAERELVILLAHLSSDNNSELLAKQTAKNIIEKSGWTPEKFHLGVVKQNEKSKVYRI